MTRRLSKKVLALILACLLIVGAIPAFATTEDETVNIAVVEAGYTVTEEGEKGDDGYPRYSTPGAAVDSFNGEGGTVWFLGTYTASGSDLEGTIADRAEVTFEGYNSAASYSTEVEGTATTVKNGITFAKVTYGQGASGNWAKGNITFKNITLDSSEGAANGCDSSLASGGYTFTFDTGVVSGSNNFMIATNAYLEDSAKDMNIVVNGGTLRYVHAITNDYYDPNSPIVNIDTSIKVNGGSVNYISPSSGANVGTTSKGIAVINGDFNVNITGGTVSNINFLTRGYGSDINVKGDSIVRISGGTVNSIYMSFNQNDANFIGFRRTDYVTPQRGNMAVIVDAATTTKAVIGGVTGISNLEFVQMAENKYIIGIINNYDSSKTNVKFDTTTTYNPKICTVNEDTGKKTVSSDTSVAYSALDRYDYKITVTDGEAQPVFVRTVDDDPSTSTLKGFTIVPNEKGLTPVINGVKLVPTGEKTENGLDIYNLSAYKSSRDTAEDDTTITAITFIDERIPVVSTDETFTPDETVYKKVATIGEAITALGANGGTVYVQGTYDFSDYIVSGTTKINYVNAFAATENITNGSLTIKGYEDGTVVGTDNTINFVRGTWGAALCNNAFKCDVTFDDITIAGSYIGEAGFSSDGHTITFGSEVVMASDAKIRISKHYGTSSTIVDDNIVINGGSYTTVATFNGNVGAAGSGGVTHNRNYNVTLNGGTVTNMYLLGDTDFKGGATLNGNINYTINGGKVNFLSVSGNANGRKNVVINGNVTFRINGGEFGKNINLGFGEISTADYYAENVTLNGHFAEIIDCATLTNNVKSYSAGSFKNIKLADYTKVMYIENNRYKLADGLAVATDAYSINEDTQQANFDYVIRVYGGAAEPEYNADNTLKGFKITPDDEYKGKLVVVNGTDVITAVDGIYDLSAYEDSVDSSSGATEITFVDAKELTVTYEQISNVSTYRTTTNTDGEYTKAPEKAGYVFGGWYESETATVAMTEAEVNAAAEAGKELYAKFVPASVLKTGWQIAKNTDSNSTETDVRLISTVDSLQYKSVRFTLVADGGIDMTMDSTTVYSGIVAYDGEVAKIHAPTDFSAASYRFMTHTVTGVPSEYFGKTLTVQASWLTKDGTRVYGAETGIVINDALNAQ